MTIGRFVQIGLIGASVGLVLISALAATNTVPALGSLPSMVISKHYTQLKQISDDVDDARVYGGIHYRFDQEAGNVLGRAVATEIYKNNLRPIHGQQ